MFKKLLLLISTLLATTTVYAQTYNLTPANNGVTVNTCKGQFLSGTGTADGYFNFSTGYGSNQNRTMTFCSSTGGPIRANFYWIDLETNFDFLYIYDGPTIASPLIATLSGSSLYPGAFTSSGTCLTFRFTSDGSTERAGWNALLGCAPVACGTNPIASDVCGSAPLICNLDGYCGSTSGWFTRDNGNIERTSAGGNNSFSCGTIQNNSWISFVASATMANFNITSSACNNPANGIQAVVFAQTACTTFTAKSSCQGNGIGTFAMSATGLIIGQTYYIMIDGFDGNDCNYVVQATGGVQTVNITSGVTTTCPGTTFNLTATATGIGPFTYNWIPAPISGQGTSVATYSSSASSSFSCVIGGACGSSQTAIFFQTINPSPTVTIAGTSAICSAGPSSTLTANATSGSGSVSFANTSDYPIPDNDVVTGATSTISVSGIAGSVGASLARVCLNISHGFVADLDISLICPNGTIIDLSSDNGGGGDNYTNTCFTNSGSAINIGTAPFIGNYTPEQALAGLSSCTANGMWRLLVKDDANLDVGTILDWTLTFNNNLTYSWSPSAGLSSTTNSLVIANPTSTTVYSVTVTDLSGCSRTSSNFTLTVNPTPTISVVTIPASSLCLGSSLSYTFSGANTYSISGATVSAINTFTPASVGVINYTINASAVNGCTNTATKSVTVNAVPIANAGTGGTLTCTNASLVLTGSGGGTYLWSGPGVVSGSTTATPTINTLGTYSLIVRSTAGCDSPISTVSVSQNTVLPTVTSVAPSVLNCTLTSVNINASTVASPASYIWTGTGITSAPNISTITVNQPGTFNYTVTNTTNGCRSTGNQVVSQNITVPTLTVSGIAVITCTAPSVVITGTANPTTSNPNWTGGVSSGGTTYSATASSAGVYTLTVTDPANGCFTSKSVTVQPSAGFPNLATAIISNSITCSTFTSQAIVTSTTTNITYNWTGTGIIGVTNTPTVNVNIGGTFALAVTNTLSACTSSTTVFIATNTVAPNPTASNTTTLTCSTTTASLIGSPSSGVTYQWSGPNLSGATTNSNAVAAGPGTYTLLVRNTINSCTNTAVTSVVQNIVLPIPTATSPTTLTCASSNSISALNASPASGVTYTWTGAGVVSGINSQNATANLPGNYTLTVRDNINGCSSSTITSVTQNTIVPLVTATSPTTLTCASSNSVSTLNGGPAAGVTYTWTGAGVVSGNNSQNSVANLPGNYTLTVRNTVNGCASQTVTTVNQNVFLPSPIATSPTSLTCVPANSVSVLNGNPSAGVTYTWTGPGVVSGTNSQNAIANAAGIYTLTVTNNINSCVNSTITTVTTNYNSPAASAMHTNSLNCTVLTSTLIGGPTTGVIYQWSGSNIIGLTTNSLAVVNGPGTYILLATDVVSGCANSAQTIVNQNIIIPTTIATTTGSITCVNSNINLNSSLAGMSYTWTAPSGSSISGGASLQNATAQGLGTYTINVLNVLNNCRYTRTVSAVQNTTTPTFVSAGAAQTLICGVPTVTLTGTATPTTATANWLGGVSSPFSFITTTGSANTYTLQAIEPTTGCFITSTVSVISSVGSPTATANLVTNSITCTNTIVTIGITPTSAGPFTFLWPSSTGISGSTTNATATATLGGVYTVTITNSPGNNCSVQFPITVPTNTTPTIASIVPVATITCNTPSLTLSASPVGSIYTYSWTGASAVLSGGSTQNPIINVGGTYSVAITNTVSGCIGKANLTVASNTVLPSVLISASSLTTTCAVPTVTLSIVSTPSTGVIYAWTPPVTGALSSNSISNPVANGSGIFTVVVTSTVSGCSSSATQNTIAVIPNLGIPTSTLSVSSLSITCFNPTPSVTVTTTSTPVVYNWTPTLGIVPGTQITASPSFSAAGTYSVVITNTVSGCASSITSNIVSVVSTTAAPSVSLTLLGGNSGTLTCFTRSISILPIITPSGLSYTWSPSLGLSSPINQANATFTLAGSYTLAVTNTLTGCETIATNTATIFNVIADLTAPTFTLSTAPSVTMTCAVPSQTLSAGSNANPTSIYTWLTPITTTVIGNPITVTTAGVYTVSVFNTSNGCNSSSVSQNTVLVIADSGIPATTLSVASASITCLNPTPSVSITTNVTAASYSWTPISGIVSGTENTANPSFNAIGIYSVIVTNTVSGCATNIVSNIVTIGLNNAVPSISLALTGNSGTLTCVNSSVSFTPVIMPNASNLTYTWSPSIGLSSSTNQANVTFTLPMVYTLALTNTLTGCVSTSTNSANTFTVFQNMITPTVTVNSALTNSVIGCTNSSVTFSANVIPNSGSLIYTWNPGSVTSSSVGITTAGMYSVVVTNTVNGCFAQTQFTVVGNTTMPLNVSAGGVNVNIPCGSPTLTLNGTSTSTNVSYSWSGPNSTSILTGSNTTNPIVGDIGNYTLTVTDNLTGCASTTVVNVLQGNITSTITANPVAGLAPLDVNFTSASNGTTNYNWNLGNGVTSTTQNANTIYTTSGTYTVTFTNVCNEIQTIIVIVEDGLSLEIPNVFTPNGDDVNDVFTIKSTGIKEISLQIFNRWGEKLYSFSGPKASWDGLNTNGTQSTDGTYFYFIKAFGFDGKSIEKNGTLNLFR